MALITLEDGIPIGVGLLLYTPQHEVLMMLRDKKPGIFYPDTWCIFTGDLEKEDWCGDLNISLEHAVRREIGEELSVNVGDYKGPFSPQYLDPVCRKRYTDYQNGNGYDRLQFVFRSGLHVPFDSLALRGEGQELRLFNKNEIEEVVIAPSYREIILRHFN